MWINVGIYLWMRTHEKNVLPYHVHAYVGQGETINTQWKFIFIGIVNGHDDIF